MQSASERFENLFKDKVLHYRELNKTVIHGQTVFAGSSLMEQFPIEKFISENKENVVIYNRGIGGYTSEDLLYTVNECILDLKPSRLFINIGTNDLSLDRPVSDMTEKYEEIILKVTKAFPDIKIYFMAYYPGNINCASGRMKETLSIRTNEKIRLANMEVEKLARKFGQNYIDVNSGLKDENGNLKAEYTVEGMHINEGGYKEVYREILKYLKQGE